MTSLFSQNTQKNKTFEYRVCSIQRRIMFIKMASKWSTHISVESVERQQIVFVLFEHVFCISNHIYTKNPEESRVIVGYDEHG